MEEVNNIMNKIRSLERIKSIVCNDCKEYHHISKDFLKIVGIDDEELDMVVNEFGKKFKECHINHNVEIKEMCPLPFGYKLFLIPFDWDIEDEGGERLWIDQK